MSPVDLIAAALVDGVGLRLEDDSLKASGESAAVSRWAALLRPHKASIIASLKVGTGETATTSRWSAEPIPLTAREESLILAWLALIKESDPATIAEVIGQCQRDAEARDYFTGRAAAELPKPAPFLDDRRSCRECRHLRGEVCTLASPGGVVSANRGYRPDPARLVRCAGLTISKRGER